MFRTSRQWVHTLSVLLMVAAMLLARGGAQAQGGGTTTVEIVGLIEAMDLDTLTVNQQVIDITTAQINTPLEVGLAVQIQGTLRADGTIVAREVNPADVGLQPGEAEFIGTLESLDAASATVSGLAFDVSAAEVQAGLAVGDMVKVHARFDAASGAWIAREVALVSPADPSAPPADSAFEIVGTLDEVGPDYVIVGGQTISAADASVADTLALGTLVRARVMLVNGALMALEISPATQTFPAPDCAQSTPRGWTTYTVQPGDTLSAIAIRTGSTVEELARVNCISNPSLLVVNMVLYVPNPPSPLPPTNTNDNDDDSNNDNSDDVSNSNDNHDDSDDDHDDNANVSQDNGNFNSNDNHDDDHSDDNSNDNADDDSHNDNNGNSNDNHDDDDDHDDDHHDD